MSAEPVKDNDTLAHEIVDQATTQPVQHAFDSIDQDHDGNVSLHEYLASSRAPERVADRRFKCADDNMDSYLDAMEFSEIQAKPREIERCISMLMAFRMVDKNQDGHLSQSELWRKVDHGSFDSRWAFMIACSDLNHDGKVSPREFSTDMYGCMEDKADQAASRFAEFNNTDTDGNGIANETEMIIAVRVLFGLSLIPTKLVSDRNPSHATKALTQKWIHCVDFDADGALSKEEYEGGPHGGLLFPTDEQNMCIGVSYNEYEADMDFQIMDSNNDHMISQQEYYDWCSNIDLEIEQQEAHNLFHSADTNKDGFIDINEFHAAGAAHQGDGPGYFFFHRTVASVSPLRSLTAWRGSIQKTWAGLFNPPASATSVL